MLVKLYLSKLYIINFFFCLVITSFICQNCATIQSKDATKNILNRHTDVSYYTNGKIEYSAEYLNDKLDGVSKHWSQEGMLISESEYSNGKPHGKWKQYYKSQAISYEMNYFYGKKNGKEKLYYENGQIKSEQTFHNGIPKETQIRWRPNGSIIY